jgi:general secretion pathway protein H
MKSNRPHVDTGFDMRATAGTTLIEALAAVSLLGLLAAIGFPRFQLLLGGLAERQTAAMVTAGLKQSRADAMREDRTRVFEADGVGFAESDRRWTAAASGARVTSAAPVVFFADGSSSGGSVMVTGGARRDRLMVSPSTGAVVEVGG